MLIKKGETKILTHNFDSSEFDCKCSYNDCHYTLIEEELYLNLQRLRDKIKEPIRISSAFRCQRHNKDVGGVDHSQHTMGAAADLMFPYGVSTQEFERLCREQFPFVLRYQTFIHCDIRLLR